MTNGSIDNLIEDLAGELEPVQPRRLVRGSLWVAGGWLVGAAAFRSVPGVLIEPLHDEFGWSRGTISAAG